MQFVGAFHQAKSTAKLAMQSPRVIPRDVQATAFLRTVQPKCAHNDITALADRVQNAPDVGGPLLRSGQEVKHGAIVPYIDGLRRQSNTGHVCLHPVNVRRGWPQPVLSHVECNLRNIQNGNVPVSSRDQIVYEGRLAAAHVNNRG